MTVPGMYRETSVEVAASPDAVYDLVSDLTRMGEWSPENAGGEWIGSGSGQVGDVFSGVNRIGDREWTVDALVTTADRGSCFAFATGPEDAPFVRWTYTMEPTGAGTRLTEIWDVNILPPTLADWNEEQLAGRAEMVAQGMETTLAGIKAAAES